MTIPTVAYRRTIQGISAVYLPWSDPQTVDFEAFEGLVDRTWRAGLTPAVNMDTGFVNTISPADRATVLAITSRLSQGRNFVAGAFVDGLAGDWIANYVHACHAIQSAGGTPILFQSSELTRSPRIELVAAYRTIAAECTQVLAFELGTMFAPFGKIYDLETFRRLLDIPTLTGIKHSSLSRALEWERIAVRSNARPDFAIYTGNDLAIDMIEWGSDYLLGLSAFYPEAFAMRDRWWSDGDERHYELSDWLQYLGCLAFRDPVPSYKHSCAMTLAMRGAIPSDAVPDSTPQRPESDRYLISQILQRIDAILANARPLAIDSVDAQV